MNVMKEWDLGYGCVVCKVREGCFEDMMFRLLWEEVNRIKEWRG